MLWCSSVCWSFSVGQECFCTHKTSVHAVYNEFLHEKCTQQWRDAGTIKGRLWPSSPGLIPMIMLCWLETQMFLSLKASREKSNFRWSYRHYLRIMQTFQVKCTVLLVHFHQDSHWPEPLCLLFEWRAERRVTGQSTQLSHPSVSPPTSAWEHCRLHDSCHRLWICFQRLVATQDTLPCYLYII